MDVWTDIRVSVIQVQVKDSLQAVLILRFDLLVSSVLWVHARWCECDELSVRQCITGPSITRNAVSGSAP